MTKPYLKPLALAVSLALSLTACGKQEPAESAAPAPSASANTAAAAPAASGGIFDVSELDPNINACQDFNGFVNDKWVAANPIPADHTSWGAFNKLAEDSLNTQHEIVEAAAKNAASAKAGSIDQKIGYLYQSGMDEATIDKAGFDPIKPRLDAIAGLKNTADIVDFIDKSYAEGNGQVFSFGAGADFDNAKLQIAYAMQSGLGLPTKDYYTKPEFKEIRDAYVAYIAKSLELTGVSAADAKAQADQVMKLETSLAAASLAPTEMRDLDNQYHFVSVKEADKITPHFSWEKFFTAQGVTIDKGFSLSQPKFFAEFDQLLAKAPVSQWQAYLRFHVADDASPYLTKAFADNKFDFYGKTLSGQPEQKPLWKRVLDATNDGMGMALGQLYVADHFSPTSKQRAEELVANLGAAFRTRIEQLEWMSDATKQKALQKWATFVPKIGYPEKWRDWSGLTLVPDNYFANVQAANKFNYDYAIAKIGKPVDRTEWGMTPQTVNAYYSAQKNEIVFPAAILQPPFFDASADDAINYGGIGAVIGHEMGHGYDDQGSKFDASGNNVNWWTDADRTAFEARTAKLGAQFDDYEALPGKHVNGQLTMGENIGDLGGLNAAYTAPQMALSKNPAEAGRKIGGYTQDQRFFLNWARVWRGSIRSEAQLTLLNTDPHAPAKFRANGAPSNMPEFARAFQCRSGDAMVRDGGKQVKIW